MDNNRDPIELAGLVTREVRTGKRDGITTRVVVARRTYPTDQADLWHALTDPERLPRWFIPVSGEFQVGGKYQLEGNAGGTIEVCDEPDRLAVTWVFGGSTSWVTVTLTPAGDETTLELEHEAPVFKPFWDQYGPGATGVGWDLALVPLGTHLVTGETIPDVGEEWSASPAGRAFLRSAATGWADAAIADGDDPDAARAASDASFAFYTPPADPTG